MCDPRDIIACCPGSFDPITRGHLDIIERASRLFSHVIVAVAVEAQKDHLFTANERVTLCQESLADLVNVTVQSFDGLLVEAAREAGVRVIVKGLREPVDLSHESPMAHMNRHLQPEIETMFLLASPQYSHVSSGLIKWVCGMGGDVAEFVPEAVIGPLRERLGGSGH